jgi:hypothetical protein
VRRRPWNVGKGLLVNPSESLGQRTVRRRRNLKTMSKYCSGDFRWKQKNRRAVESGHSGVSLNLRSSGRKSAFVIVMNSLLLRFVAFPFKAIPLFVHGNAAGPRNIQYSFNSRSHRQDGQGVSRWVTGWHEWMSILCKCSTYVHEFPIYTSTKRWQGQCYKVQAHGRSAVVAQWMTVGRRVIVA